jgi:large subunit ribosomal protein L29
LGSRRAQPGSARGRFLPLGVWSELMRARDLRNMTDDELDRKMAETRQELFNLHFQTATGVLENSARLRTAKREIARILTVKNERARGLTR